MRIFLWSLLTVTESNSNENVLEVVLIEEVTIKDDNKIYHKIF